MEKIAVFPIPNCVAFPGNSMPLHVFEPRYRQMVDYCVNQRLPLGVCHVEKVLQQAKTGQTVAEALNSNQATYKPVPILTAGQVDIIETFRDGRLLIEINLNQRFQLFEQLQTLPFFIYNANRYDDITPSPELIEKADIAKSKVLHRLQALAAQVPELSQLLASPEWQTKTPEQLSYELFQFIQLDSEVMQAILEERTAERRLISLLDVLNKITPRR
ncbi:MAG: ATP-dependent protease [Oceanospirillales bacterium]|nr:MAG: ATP-dependent protease [Oceanospirillales bacterium]